MSVMEIGKDEPIINHCQTCGQGVHWMECPVGGWWIHDDHPIDDHDAVAPCPVQEQNDRGEWHTVRPVRYSPQ